MVLGIGRELFAAVHKGGWEVLVCDSNKYQQSGDLYFWYYIFFLSKFYEFIDTYILILRQKPVTFLHSFHHFITAFLCWAGLSSELAVQWIIIVINGSVHVLMYYYYLAQTLGSDVWWKKHLTTAQITQFVIDLLFTSSWYYFNSVSNQKCSGSLTAIYFTHFVLGSFLILFINFFVQTYKKPTAKSE